MSTTGGVSMRDEEPLMTAVGGARLCVMWSLGEAGTARPEETELFYKNRKLAI